ncbi:MULTISPECIES: sulfate ABC transporter permease subunit CysT [unclassified Paenibacillus]|uniref:sulfate ABC transporter permease subunit CysT n=1 Tax=unclassified Paenibacillus TaxID=185978 RepID=UPI0024070D0D|nr:MULTISPECIES: sulfate ABC transporter permease subunit CysT [unclassified Paenibacillus]MDF9840962.1 sulfate transport system permease protein [Paenibacillus sp. PastF-2]MDF9847546.1 sulfate transport system permease protein [Paenibacillus sp. PastM-2]MDF9853878.1 sulfate transport system permease protein [Paenibacillus sp. PastF-1]MDH6479149.1 sulfate transport system permease protein [Paenibacillus sp. PastH-2]MDH6507114.1 sulfate transport system permease protein [Paenibacillus sp. PastM
MNVISTAAARRKVLPGFGITMGYSVLYLSLIVLLPLSALLFNSTGLSWAKFWDIATDPRVLASYRVSIGTAAAAALANAFFGLLMAWVLVRYEFPGKRIFDALIDLPFALPTAVAGVSLTALYSQNGWIGSLFEPYGFKIAFTPLGITLALMFIGIPFVVRTVQPVLEDLERDMEEAAATLGAGRGRIFLRIILPEVFPALLTGFALAFARGIGEYGSVVFISGNMPMRTEIAPLLIMSKLEQFDYAGATAVALLLLLISFLMLLVINLLQRWARKTSR